jgi:glycosyltransferase involved in cell wall biosynthesis
MADRPVDASLVVSIVVGPAEHGANRHATTIASITGTRLTTVDDAQSITVDLAERASLVHLHYTDRLWGDDATSAARAFCDATARLDRPIVATLHDLPDGNGTDRDRRRADAYRLVAQAAAAPIVASSHERTRLLRCGTDAHVIALPIEPTDRPPARQPTEPATVVVLGFLYPGKGHDDVVDAAAALPSAVRVVCAGAASLGHEDLPDALRRRAGGRPVDVTGTLDASALTAIADTATVPIVPARNPSASASLATWIGLGRRPLVADNPFVREIADHEPGLVTLYDPTRPGALAEAIAHAIATPRSTWRTVAVPDALRPVHVAAQHLAVYDAAMRRRQP